MVNRRDFFHTLAVAGLSLASADSAEAFQGEPTPSDGAPIAEFHNAQGTWKVYEDLSVRDGAITFVSPSGARRVLRKSTEACFEHPDPQYLGIELAQIGTAGPDLLAEKLLAHGDPDPEEVRGAAPPLGSGLRRMPPGARYRWDTFVGTREASDTMPVFPGGNTRTYHPTQYFDDMNGEAIAKRYEGLVGGWMPAVLKVLPISENAYMEMIVFGDVMAHDRFIVQTWHRTTRIENGRMVKAVYGHSYPAYPPHREDPSPEEFYRALLEFAEYWDRQLHDMAPASLPDNSWVDMSRYAFAKELMVRPGGDYPKYGAVDRDYYGSEYDGFQDIFTMAVYTNLEWGRFEQARAIIDNYFSQFVDSKGMINMRGPETAQFGMTLSLLARYAHYTGDHALLAKYRPKIEATAAVLTDMHDLSLKLPHDDPGYGIIHGWSESDSCLARTPQTWWLPYYANNAFASRGLNDIAVVWERVNRAKADGWRRRAAQLKETTIARMRANVRNDMTPPYIGIFPGTKLTFRESMATERPSPQQWSHRAYTELLQADVLPADLANTVINCMRAYGATTLGVVANVGRPHARGRDILGFISYGYAQMLLRLDRAEEYLLFLYSHRFHDHTPGSWTAGEVAGITGGTALFCIPAQQTIPLLVRWMLVLEDSDADRLYFGKGLPRKWVASGKPVSIERAPTRWGPVSYRLASEPSAKRVTAQVTLARPGAPRELEAKLRLPAGSRVRSVTVNGRPARLGGPAGDTVLIETGSERHFDIQGQID
jgi:hypothetical protein